MEIAARRDLIVIEDACQGVGGGYEGRNFGADRPFRRFSFNYYKNMTCGEGGGVAVNDDVARRARALRHRPLPLLLAGPQRRRETVLRQRRAGLRADGRDAERPARPHRRHDRRHAAREEDDPGGDRARSATSALKRIADATAPTTTAPLMLCTTCRRPKAAKRFAELFPSVIAGKTGRHNYTEWDQVLMGAGAAHPAMNPFNLRGQRRNAGRPTPKTCAPVRWRSSTARSWSPRIPSIRAADTDDIIHNIGVAARVALGGAVARRRGPAQRQARRCAEVRHESGRVNVGRKIGGSDVQLSVCFE